MKIDKGLMAGSTPLMLLSMLAEGDKYGYEIIQELSARSDQTFQLKEGTLYPILHSLEKSGEVISYTGPSTSGKPRKYYRLTKQGEAALRERREQWKNFCGMVNAVVFGTAHA